MTLTWQQIESHTRRPFQISRPGGSVDGTSKVGLVVSYSADGIVGLGEATPVTYYHQSIESCQETLELIAALPADNPAEISVVIDDLLRRFPDQPAAVAAVDVALHDWLGKKRSLPVWQVVGVPQTTIPHSSMTIGIDDLSAISPRVEEAEAFEILKIKLGTDHDREILQNVRHHAPDKRLRVDANGAWRPDQALDRLHMLADFGVELVEQPMAPEDDDHLAALTEAELLPVFVDESCRNADDLPRLAGCVTGVNIKLCKCGGIQAGLVMIRRARQLGLKIMIGCMVETSLGISAAVQVAPLADYADLDGHLLLADDPFEGVGGAGGRFRLNETPGLGIRPRSAF